MGNSSLSERQLPEARNVESKTMSYQPVYQFVTYGVYKPFVIRVYSLILRVWFICCRLNNASSIVRGLRPRQHDSILVI